MVASAQLMEEALAPASLELRSRGLQLVLSRIEYARWREHDEEDAAADPPGKATLLELGAPLAANIAYLNAYRCRLYLADAYRALHDLSMVDAVEAAAGALPVPEGTQLDAVFAWDLLWFLEPPVVTALATALGRHCGGGALLHALAYTGEHMPAEPAGAHMFGDAEIEYRAGTPAVRPNPKHSPIALERMLPGFKLRHSFLLPGGLQDYLFSFE